MVEEGLLSLLCLGLTALALGLLLLHHFLPFLLKLGFAPRGSFGFPLVGETLQFLSPHASNSLGFFLEDHISRYGKVFKSHLFFTPTIVSCDMELNQFILQNEEKLFQCSYPKPIHGILGKSSMIVVVGETHKKLRSLALTLVNTTRSSAGYLIDIEKIAIQLIDSWKKRDRILFCEEARKARERISLTVKSIVEERRKKNTMDSSINKRKDFLDVLLSTSNLSDEEKVSFVLDSLLGGYETTSLLISMAVYFLGQSPSSLKQLKVINEALRCGNIVKFVHRKALRDVIFKDYIIPSGWQVLPVISAVHLDSSFHRASLLFNPWRWEDQNQLMSKSFTPFGGGPRLCPGSELARVEAAIFLHHFVLKYRWRIEGDDIPMAHPYVDFPKGLPIVIDPNLNET
ncbi:Cytochrome P450 724B1 [Apostasia shenzhenica]|uniref:Cytochrome P450 724B1 n=1 Tax=Apostasia shenzhenica TaxID=1088818 RepID=A0A2I0A0V1_9ASPA|nr:Cytochrome P450 724B1 [Apostasia shenzhenica]